ncbi:LOG family protein yvdD [Listeria grayi]|uniref:Cytokinin riboside 5'-monophosphate phosphoribohydrolase n=2 Tax=Listeria grayi TaxID=1641 RepID=A0A829R6R0_LISGR|nr:TIGR00730 family Rossman fold protein [Listeria grayi]EUJ27724.1 hypothetical protein LMUR_09364 [Listeria grayi FSL F6-1183]MBC1920988.1 TIGR00730 family Rossman fold protein [Listeria grayi]STY43660.1 LOG family protein yvdD [Listeria grayi]VEI34895.1 LOG family protein yvdD [Listeria grayi]
MHVAIYCGASAGNDPVYKECAVKIGKWLGEKGHTLVYGGGRTGLMGEVAQATLESGGKAIGVMPAFLKERELAYDGLTELHIVDTMDERKKMMMDMAACYVALPGGPGTLEEITEVISWGRVGQHQNPCVFFNEKGYYDGVKHFYQQMVTEGFLTQVDFEKILFTNSTEEIEAFKRNYLPPVIRTYTK